MSDSAAAKSTGKRARRVDAGFTAEFMGRQVEGRGVVRNISLSGALIEQASNLLVARGFVRLRFTFVEGALPVVVDAEVVRETPSGFAVRFVNMDPRVREVLRRAITRLDAAHTPDHSG